MGIPGLRLCYVPIDIFFILLFFIWKCAQVAVCINVVAESRGVCRGHSRRARVNSYIFLLI